MCCTRITQHGVPLKSAHRTPVSHHKSNLGPRAVKTSFADCCDGISILSNIVVATCLVVDFPPQRSVIRKEKKRLKMK